MAYICDDSPQRTQRFTESLIISSVLLCVLCGELLEQLLMKQSQFNKLEMMMLADSNRNVVFGNELMVDDNFDMPLSKEDPLILSSSCS